MIEGIIVKYETTRLVERISCKGKSENAEREAGRGFESRGAAQRLVQWYRSCWQGFSGALHSRLRSARGGR